MIHSLSTSCSRQFLPLLLLLLLPMLLLPMLLLLLLLLSLSVLEEVGVVVVS